MSQRLCFLATLVGVALLASDGRVEAGDGQKKLQAAMARCSAVKADEQVADGDARLTEMSAAIDAVAAESDADAAKMLLTLMSTPFPHASVEVFVTEKARDALVGMPAGAGRDELRTQLDKKKKDPRVAVPLAEVISGWKEQASARALGDLLSQRDDRLVMAGARGLARLKMKECVAPLIAAFGALAGSGGEPLEAVGGALFEITGQGFRTQEDWAKWWQTAEATFDPNAPREGGAGTTRVRSFQPKTPSLFETEIRSKKIVIVLDVSGSMHIRNYVHDPIEEPPPPGPREPKEGTSERDKPAGSTTGEGGAIGGQGDAGGAGGPGAKPRPAGPPLPPGVNPDDPNYKKKPCVFAQCPGAKGTGPECPSDENLPMWYRRHDRLMRQVSAVVRSFGPDVSFNLVAFSTDARTFKGNTLLPASEANKKAALKWIDGLQPNGATLATKAMEVAFNFADADTILFVTDGAPTNPAGRPYDPSRWRELLDEVKRLNKTRKVRIDVITIAEGHTDFARGLASENSGTYSSVP